MPIELREVWVLRKSDGEIAVITKHDLSDSKVLAHTVERLQILTPAMQRVVEAAVAESEAHDALKGIANDHALPRASWESQYSGATLRAHETTCARVAAVSAYRAVTPNLGQPRTSLGDGT